jgi:hypothetical protein
MVSRISEALVGSESRERLHRRWSTLEPDKDLAAVIPSAIPVKQHTVKTLVYLKTKYPLTNNFLLQALSLGFDSFDAVAGFLGLEKNILSEAVAEELVAGTIASIDGTLSLTTVGQHFLNNLERIKSENKSFEIPVDLILGEIQDYGNVGSLDDIYAQQRDYLLADEGITPLKAPKREWPTKEFFDLDSLNRLNKAKDLTIVQVDSVETKRTKKNRYKFCWLLVFVDVWGDQTHHVIVDGVDSDPHFLALNTERMIDLQGVKVDDRVDAPPLGVALEESGLIDRDKVNSLVDIARKIPEVESIESDAQGVGQGPTPQPKAIPLTGLGQFLVENSTPSRISVYQHAGLLQDALMYAKERILIISPWIKGNVVNESFINLVRGALRRGVKVTVAYGYEEALSDNRNSISRLCQLAKENDLEFLRHQNTHAKVLLVDHCYVTSSFNWLSFQGSEDRTYRMEEGTKFMSKEFADDSYDEMIRKLRSESEKACP